MLAPPAGIAQEWSGWLAFELRAFPDPPADARQAGNGLSLAFETTYDHELAGGDQRLRVVVFGRFDQHDSERTHLDLRELSWEKRAASWELRLGIRKDFWGVTESQHLVDVVNSTDGVEGIAGEAKLGQPMVNLALVRRWGTLDFYLLPGFRQPTFPGRKGRLRFSLPVETDLAEFESAAGEGHVDWALRWGHTVDAWDLGLSHFSGTSREARFKARVDDTGEAVLAPLYDQVEQTSFDLQTAQGSWLWKLELLSRRGQGPRRFTAFTAGFEHTLVGVLGTQSDLGLLAEYQFNDRRIDAFTPFEDDLFLAVRWALNDVQGSELLAGVIVDRSSGAGFWSFEGRRRLGDRWTIQAEARAFVGISASDPLIALRSDDHLQITLLRFF